MENIISDTKINVNLVSMEEIMRLLLGWRIGRSELDFFSN